ncbi:MAG: sigma-70 family RNA polymerase sigma factor [Myxococcales bacterium]|nr:sigma-70 family RNA polymerase sigma factor [Myxococcales bacterium]MCB9734654.1 sigma-70 family RNA polymerase sigma factor [Deltaproteobacteria bacterium]
MASQEERKNEDQELVRRAQAGDQKAFREIVERYQRKVYTIAYGIVRNPDVAMDVVQDAFVKVYRHLGSFQGNSSFYTWLYRIVVNLCIDKKRRAARASEVDYDDALSHEEGFTDGPTLASTGIENPFKAAQRKELVEHMDEALDTLSEDHREILLLREVDGLSYEELAETLGIAKGTVMSRLFHARKNFQKSLMRYLVK